MDYQLWVDYHLLWCAFHSPLLPPTLLIQAIWRPPKHTGIHILILTICNGLERKMTQDNWYDSRLPSTADPAMTMEWTRNCIILMLCLYFSTEVLLSLCSHKEPRFFFSWARWTEAQSYRHIRTGLLMRFPLTPDEPRHCQFLALRSAAVCTTWLKHFF